MSNTKISKKVARPTSCDHCSDTRISLVTNDALYGRIYGDWPLIWYCSQCTAAVGCHPGTDIPLGKMADRLTRKWRKKAHDAFDPIWRNNSWLTRHKAYCWLAHYLQLERDDCPIGTFSIDQSKEVIRLCTEQPPMKKDFRRKK